MRPALRLPPVILAALLGVGAALWMLYPAWLDGAHAVVGDWRHPDMISNHWLYRWVAERLLAGESLLHNDRYYYPVGDAPWLAGNGSDAVPYTLVAAWLPWPGSVTLWVLLTIALNGVAGWALARAAGARSGALLAALALALCPYVAHEAMGMRLSQAPLYWTAFFLAAWLRLLDRPTAGRGLLAGLLYAATALTYWYQGLWAAMAGAVLFAFRPRLRALAGFLPAAVLPVAPVLALFLRHWSDIPGTSEDVFPHPLALASSLPPTFPVWTGAVERHEVATSLVVLLLAGWGLRRPRRWWAGGFAAVAVVFYALALGPDILLPSGADTGIPGPFRLVYGALPPLRRFWWPYRHAAVMLVALLPLAARGLDDLLDRAGRRAPAALLAVLAVLPLDLALRGGRLDVPVSWWEAPAAYERLRDLPGEAILELPIAPELATSQQTLSYQWVHRKKLVNGHAMWVDRVRPDAWDAWVAGNTFLSRLQEYERGRLFGPFAFRPEDVAALHELGIRYLVVNAEYFPKALYGLVPNYRVLLTEAFGPPVLSFRDHLFAWDVDRYGWKGALEAPEFRLPEGYLAEADGSRMLDLGYNRPLGWRTVARLFPPVIPPRGEDLPAAEAPVPEAPAPPPARAPDAPAGPSPGTGPSPEGYAPAPGVAPPQPGADATLRQPGGATRPAGAPGRDAPERR